MDDWRLTKMGGGTKDREATRDPLVVIRRPMEAMCACHLFRS